MKVNIIQKNVECCSLTILDGKMLDFEHNGA